jgi:hypothetical protein
MNWRAVDDKHKKHFDKNFVSCEEPYERRFMINTILQEFPLLSTVEVAEAVDHCCNTIPAPRPRDRFIQCLKEKLG